MTSKGLWKSFQVEHNIKTEEYQVWKFGCDADGLLDLVLKGEKTATSSAHIFYILENEKLPKKGIYSVILNSKEEAICIIQTTKVYLSTFNHITKEHAYKEGEGDKSLEYWRDIHKEFFSVELLKIGKKFDENMKVVCEEFVLVYQIECGRDTL